MSRAGFAVALIVSHSALGSGDARADQSLHAVTTVSTGYTDNVQLVPDNPSDPTLVPQVENDAFANVAPGLIFAHEGPRIAQVVRYVMSARLYAEQSSANSYSNSLSYQALLRLTPRTEMSVDAAASHGRLNAFDTAAEQTSLDTRAQGDIAYARGAAGVSLARTLSRSWRIQDAVGVSVFQPTDDTTQVRTRYTLENALSLTKALRDDAFSGALRAVYSSLDRGTDDSGDELEDEESITSSAELRWVHDLSQTLSTDAMAGVAFTVRADNFSRGLLLPVGAAYLRYQKERYAAALGYRHQVQTNILIAETEATNTFEGRGSVPVPWVEDVSLAGAAGYAHGRSLDLGQEQLLGTNDRWVGDLAISWRATPELRLAARYQIVWQTRTQPDLDIMDERTRRNQFMVILEGRYPSRQAVEIRQRNEGRADGGESIEGQRESGQVR